MNQQVLDQINQTNLDSITTASSYESVVYSIVSMNKSSSNRSNFVETINDLPDIFQENINDGILIYVNAINLHVVSNNEKWYTLDGRLVRNDSSTKEIWSWGTGTYGRLGDGTTTSRSSPVSVVGGFTDWCIISAGWTHAAAIRSDGTIWTWGSNVSSRLGDGTTISKSSPVSVVGGFTDWCAVSAGSYHTAALRTNGTIWTWGGGTGLGNINTSDKNSPTIVVGGFTDWCGVSAGRGFNSAIRTNGTIWTWGSGSQGRLGDGYVITRSSPVSVVGGFTDWCAVSAGFYHSTGIRTNCTLWTWGCGGNGRLGDGYEVDRSSPVSVVGGFTDWCAVSTGGCHTAALRTNGTLWTWGNGVFGRLGDGYTVNRSSPVSVVGGFTDWCTFSAGGNHTAAIRTNGTLWTWGNSLNGQLGDGTTTSRSSPVSVVGGFTDWCRVSAGLEYIIALRLYN